jgi:superfamily II DNA/RNA helicase
MYNLYDKKNQNLLTSLKGIKNHFNFSPGMFEFLSEPLKKALENGLLINSKPTEVQTQAFQAIYNRAFDKRDVIISSPTGSGKTLAYLLPLLSLMHPEKKARTEGPLILILVPTRELAVQIEMVLEKLLSKLKPHWIVSGSLSGGTSRETEKLRLRKGLHIVVATPGRLQDHLKNTQSLNSNKHFTKFIVVDEVDRMVDSGFGPTVREIIEQFNRPPLILVSATTQNLIENPFLNLLPDPQLIQQNLATPTTLVQNYCLVPTKLRLAFMVDYLQKFASSAIVFVSCRDVVDFLSKVFVHFLPNKGIFSLHGESTDRKRILSDFHSQSASKSCLLICTDVVARGIDFSKIPLIIQFEPPSERADYIHRIGRSARQGQSGESLLILLEHELPYIPLLNLPIAKKELGSIPALFKLLDRLSHSVSKDKQLSQLAERAYRSAIRAYATHAKDEKIIFHPKKIHIGHYAGSFGLPLSDEDGKETTNGKMVPKKTGLKKSNSDHNRSVANRPNEIPERNRLTNKTVTKPMVKKRISSGEFDAF